MVKKANPNVVKEMMRDIADFLLSKAQDNIINMGISDRGELLGSGEVKEIGGEIFVEFDAPQATFVNDGTRPHGINKEGQDAIRAWVERKLSVSSKEVDKVANAIIWKIRKKGTLPKPFFDNAVAVTAQTYRGVVDLT